MSLITLFQTNYIHLHFEVFSFLCRVSLVQHLGGLGQEIEKVEINELDLIEICHLGWLHTSPGLPQRRSPLSPSPHFSPPFFRLTLNYYFISHFPPELTPEAPSSWPRLQMIEKKEKQSVGAQPKSESEC